MDNNENKVLTSDDIRFNKMLKSFMNQVRKEGIVEEVIKRRYYMKPSAKKRLDKDGKPRRK